MSRLAPPATAGPMRRWVSRRAESERPCQAAAAVGGGRCGENAWNGEEVYHELHTHCSEIFRQGNF